MATGAIWTRWCFVITPRNVLYEISLSFFTCDGNVKADLIVLKVGCGELLLGLCWPHTSDSYCDASKESSGEIGWGGDQGGCKGARGDWERGGEEV